MKDLQKIAKLVRVRRFALDQLVREIPKALVNKQFIAETEARISELMAIETFLEGGEDIEKL